MCSLIHSVRSRTWGLLVLVLTIPILGSSNAVQAQQVPTQVKQKPPTPGILSNSSAIEIKVDTFRKQIVPGTSIGVIADITNHSSAPIYLRDHEVHLVLPPEVERPDVGTYSTDGWFPTEYMENPPHIISLKPNETYRVFWNRAAGMTPQEEGVGQQAATNKAGKSSWIANIRRYFQFIGFAPGVYPIMVEAKYWDQRKFDGDDYHTVVETKDVEFAAPQRIILLGAALGGLIFTVLGMVRAEQNASNSVQSGQSKFVKTLGKTLAILFGSILLSVIITILLSRIAETQFFIKVSVSDFWGAIAVGFLANYGGWALLDKMVPGGGTKGLTKEAKQTNAHSADPQVMNRSTAIPPQ